jgi:predicted SAM-dependent methyltransferase
MLERRKPSPSKLHLGCGSVILPGYTNIDEVYHPGVDTVDNVRFLRRIKKESVDEIYACHVLEHFGRWEYMHALKRWYAILKPFGILKISVPNFTSMVQYHTDTGKIEDLIGLLYGGQDSSSNCHRYIWTEDSLSKDLKKVGFSSLQRYRWEDEEHAYIHDFSQAYLPHAVDEVKRTHKPPVGGGYIQMSLNMLAVK